jgi:ribosomal protein S12 methylthiotransferase accessory factor
MLLSKTSDVYDSIEIMQTLLANRDINVVFKREFNPIHNLFWANLVCEGIPHYVFSNGKGSTFEASKASALGEFIERLATHNFFSEFYIPNAKPFPDAVAFEYKRGYLNPKLLKFYNPNRELEARNMIDFNSDEMQKIIALPFKNILSGEEVFFPIAIIQNLYASNGLASGNSPIEAQIQALSEIIERFVKFEVIKNGYALPAFPSGVIARFPKLKESVAFLESLGYEVRVLDSSLGGVFPVSAIALINPKNGTLFVSFGSHPMLEVCLERTMSELMQGRTLKDLDNFETPTFDRELVSDSSNLESHFIDSNGTISFGFLSDRKSFDYAPWVHEGDDREKEHAYLVNIFKKLKKEVYLREYAGLGFYACQVIVPDFSEVYPIDDLVYNNKNEAKFIRQKILNFQDYDLREIVDELDEHDETIDVGKYIGVVFKQPFTIREFKIHLLLLLGAKSDALELLRYGSNNRLGEGIKELLLLELQALDFDDFKASLYRIFGRDLVSRALDSIDNRASLLDMEFDEEYIAILRLYGKIV